MTLDYKTLPTETIEFLMFSVMDHINRAEQGQQELHREYTAMREVISDRRKRALKQEPERERES